MSHHQKYNVGSFPITIGYKTAITESTGMQEMFWVNTASHYASLPKYLSLSYCCFCFIHSMYVFSKFCFIYVISIATIDGKN